jgi:hypothetical protein
LLERVVDVAVQLAAVVVAGPRLVRFCDMVVQLAAVGAVEPPSERCFDVVAQLALDCARRTRTAWRRDGRTTAWQG